MDLKGSKTEKNLYRTFLGESRARNILYMQKRLKRKDINGLQVYLMLQQEMN